MAGVRCVEVGHVTAGPRLDLAFGGRARLSADLPALVSAWKETLADA